MNKKMNKEIISLVVWMALGGVVSELVIATGWIEATTVRAFAGGAFICFAGLTALGGWRYREQQRLNQEALEQFQRDQRADQEQQAEIDRGIIEKLRNEHELSGSEQDRRLKALEAALKHLKGK